MVLQCAIKLLANRRCEAVVAESDNRVQGVREGAKVLDSSLVQGSSFFHGVFLISDRAKMSWKSGLRNVDKINLVRSPKHPTIDTGGTRMCP